MDSENEIDTLTIPAATKLLNKIGIAPQAADTVRVMADELELMFYAGMKAARFSGKTAPAPTMTLPAQMGELRRELNAARELIVLLVGIYVPERHRMIDCIDRALKLCPLEHSDQQGGKPVDQAPAATRKPDDTNPRCGASYVSPMLSGVICVRPRGHEPDYLHIDRNGYEWEDTCSDCNEDPCVCDPEEELQAQDDLEVELERAEEKIEGLTRELEMYRDRYHELAVRGVSGRGDAHGDGRPSLAEFVSLSQRVDATLKRVGGLETMVVNHDLELKRVIASDGAIDRQSKMLAEHSTKIGELLSSVEQLVRWRHGG